MQQLPRQRLLPRCCGPASRRSARILNRQTHMLAMENKRFGRKRHGFLLFPIVRNWQKRLASNNVLFFCTVNLYLCEMCFLPQIGRVSTNTVVDVTNTNWDPHREDLGFSKVLMPADKQGIDQRRVGVSKSNILDTTQQNWYLGFPSCSHLFNHSNYNPNLIGSAANCWIMKLGQAKSLKSLAEVPAVPAVPAVGGANLKRYNWNGEWNKTYGNLYICMGHQQNNQHIYIYIIIIYIIMGD